MRQISILLLVLVCAFSGFSQIVRKTRLAATQATKASVSPANSLPIRRVILYSNGVAYIERRGTVSGNAEVNLSFKQSQVDDVLKSMVVLDLGQGKIGAVSYNSSEPVSARMSEIPFSVSPTTAEGSGIAGVLSQLQGAKVAVTSAKGTATGSVLTVERKTVRDEKGATTTTSILVIASESGEISSFDLSEIRTIKLLDEGTRNDLSEFANAAASARRLDAKTITVTSEGTGTREMIVSYTIAAPIWKTTYRVVLDKEGKPFFQGWAIVDNISEEDWSDVQMSLVSGSPISFIQNLQKPFYRYRPVVSPPRDLQLRPQMYEPEGVSVNSQPGTIGTSVTAQQVTQLPLNNREQTNLLQLQSGVSAQSNVIVDGMNNSNVSVNSNYSRSSTSVSDALTNNNSGVTTAATGEEIGDLFEYRIDRPVTVARNRSALIPIVQTKMDGERIAVYNEGVRRDRPMSGVLLKNTTGLTLESGSMTVLDSDAYAGEALMDRLKPKERRIVSFALDLGTNIRVRQTENREPAKLIKAVNGTFQVHYFQTEEKVYQIANQTDRTKVLYIEYPVRDDWILSDDSPKPDYVTQRYYRFRVELNGFEEKDIKISLRQPLMDSYQLTALSTADLELFVTRRYINEETRAKLAKLIELRASIFQIDNRLENFDDEVEKIENDQKRLRENIESLAKTAEAKALIARYIAKAGEQETRLEDMEKERKTIAADKERLERQLAVEITVFEIK